MGKLTIDVSDELIKLFPSKKEAKEDAKQAMVFDLVRRGKISKGRAAELLGISLWNLPELLAQYDIPWFNYSPDDLKHDVETLEELFKNKGN
jgi:predicted HTH domain antitoxin